MSQSAEAQEFLNSLLVTDRSSLTFLHQTLFGQRGSASLEQAAVEVAAHAQGNQGRLPEGIKRWIRAPSTLTSHHRTALVRLAGHYRDESISEDLLGILRQLTFVASHPAAISALAQVQGIRASKTLTELLWSAPTRQWHVRETAILRELGRMGWSSAISHLIRALAVPYDNPARAASEALARFDPDEALPPLLKVIEVTATAPPRIEAGQDARQIAGAADALGRLGDERAIPALQRLADVDDAQVACAAAVALARLGDPEAEGRLVRLAYADRGHAGAELRARAIAALGVLAQSLNHQLGEGSINTLYQGLSDSQPEVRSAAALAIGDAGRPAASRAIAEALRKEVSPLVRTAAIRALGRLGHSLSLPILLDALRRDEASVKIEVLDALAGFRDPQMAHHIAPWRASQDERLAAAADRALRRLLHRPFEWPAPAAIEGDGVAIDLYTLEDARRLLLPPASPAAPVGFFGRLFGASAPEPPPAPRPIGRLTLTAQRAQLSFEAGRVDPGWQPGAIDWERRFSLQVTREPIGPDEGAEDIGVHFTLRQRPPGAVAAALETIALSLWCAPSEAVGRLTAKSERLACLDPHQAPPFLAAVRWYMEVHGEPMAYV